MIQAYVSHLPATQTSNPHGVGPLPPCPLGQTHFTGSISKLIASKYKKDATFTANHLSRHSAEEPLDEIMQKASTRVPGSTHVVSETDTAAP